MRLNRRGSGPKIRVLTGQMEWILTPSDTGGQYCMLETFVPPGGGVPPHQHPDHEAFSVIEGSIEVARMDESGLSWIPASAGDVINVPSDEIHGFRNTNDAPARLLVTGSARLGAFFEEAGVPLAVDTAPSAPTAQDVQRVLAIAQKYGHRFLPREH
jgi:quercetin dioxygenase-like cupin family protein